LVFGYILIVYKPRVKPGEHDYMIFQVRKSKDKSLQEARADSMDIAYLNYSYIAIM